MNEQKNQTPDTGEVQVFELTMDNPEDQDELNRRMRKPGETDCCPPAKISGAALGESKTASPKSNPN